MLKDKIAIVTGASAGIGLATAKAFIQEGCTVIGLARRKGKMMSEMEDVKGKERFHPYECDLTKPENIETTFQSIKTNFGIVHILVNNAGMIVYKKFMESSRNDWEKLFDLNVMAYLDCAKYAAKMMLDANVESYIVNINSVEGHFIKYYANIEFNMYPATKHAISAITEIMGRDFRGSKIRVSSISPGLVATNLLQAAKADEDIPKLNLPILYPKDVANLILYLIGTPQHVLISDVIIRPLGEV